MKNGVKNYAERIMEIMKDGKHRTIDDIHCATYIRAGSIGSTLRRLRAGTDGIGPYEVNKKHLGNHLYSFQVVVPGAV